MPTTINDRVALLRPRHRQIVRLVSLGCSVPEIASILGLARSTADNYRARAMQILATDKAALVTRIAITSRISPLGDKLTAAEKRKSGRKGDGWN